MKNMLVMLWIGLAVFSVAHASQYVPVPNRSPGILIGNANAEINI
jgi:hypothetical protein